MSNFARMILRRGEAKRKQRVRYEYAGRPRRKAITRYDRANDRVYGNTTSDQHRTGDQWWRGKLAELAEKPGRLRPGFAKGSAS